MSSASQSHATGQIFRCFTIKAKFAAARGPSGHFASLAKKAAAFFFSDVALRLQLGHFTPQALDFNMIRLQLTLAGKGLRRIGGQFLHSAPQHVFLQIEIARRLSYAHAPLMNQPNRLNLELPTEYPSRHKPPPVS